MSELRTVRCSWKRIGGFVITLLLLWQTVPVTAGEDTWVGLLRADGTLIPIVRYSGGAWLATGSTMESAANNQRVLGVPDGIATPPAAESVPKRWYVTTTEKSDHPVNVIRPIEYQFYCHAVHALETDYLRGRPPPDSVPHRALGAVASQLRALVGFVDARPEDDVGKKILVKAAPELARAETLMVEARIQSHRDTAARDKGVVDGRLAYLGTPVEASERQKVPLNEVRLIRSARSIRGAVLYKLSAVKEYNRPQGWSDPGCMAYTRLGAWFSSDGGVIRFLGASASLADCDGKGGGSPHYDPYAFIELDRSVYLLAENLVYGGHFYQIDELHADRFENVLKVYGGGC